MKRKVFIIFLFSFVLIALKPDTKKIAKSEVGKIKKCIVKGEFKKALSFVDILLKQGKRGLEIDFLKYQLSMRLEEYEEGLNFIEKRIKEEGEKEHLLDAKYHFFMAKNDIREALKVAIKKNNITEKENCWDSYNIFNLYMKIKDYDNAYKYLGEAIKRGFIDYNLLESTPLDKTLDNSRLLTYIDEIKKKLKLGEKITEFKVFDDKGGEVTSQNYKGKMLLLYLSSSGCQPCNQFNSYLKSLYKDYHSFGLEILEISLDRDKEGFKKYKKEKGGAWLIYSSYQGWEDKTVKKLGLKSLPGIFIIDRDSYLRAFGFKGNDLKNSIIKILKEEKQD